MGPPLLGKRFMNRSSSVSLIIIFLALFISAFATWPQAFDLSTVPSLPSQQPLTAPTRLVFGLKIPLHQATAQDLSSLPGLGPVKAQNIVDFLQTHGPIARFDALLQIPGMGLKTLVKIKPYLSL